MKAPAVDGLHGFVLHDACWNLLQRLPGASDLSLERLLSGYKITAIAVHAKQPDEGENMATQASSLRHTAIWYPDIPPENLLLNEDSFIGSDTPSTIYEPLSWILFGGDRGDKLPFVKGLLYTQADGLRGLRFEYDDTADETCRDASPVKLGYFEERQQLNAPRLSIKGARGEHICSLSIGLAPLEYDERPGLLRHGHPEHVAITTNQGRTKKIGKRSEMMKMHEITVAPGTTITGLYGHYDLECGMVNIGVISERL
ncbi:F-box domain-containing protein [Cordyceps javanica]|uniref:F-box domain-containing protein n=1 Tax=Cordyceps javanica TaxID=43265 RepID=A0A545URR2_9HYPO|nr:F-box domain-containing protein [Cordyceps javanica]TQW04079.1 F-box domain containing protein [Cordyceps javanica]